MDKSHNYRVSQGALAIDLEFPGTGLPSNITIQEIYDTLGELRQDNLLRLQGRSC